MKSNILEEEVEITRHVSGEYFIRCLAEFNFQEPYEFMDEEDKDFPYQLELTEDPELVHNPEPIMYMMCNEAEYQQYHKADRATIMRFVMDNAHRLDLY